MDCFCGLHNPKLSGAVTAKIILNEGCDAQINGDDPLSGNARCPQTRKGNASTILRRSAAQVHCRIYSASAREQILQLPIGCLIGWFMPMVVDPPLSSPNIRPQFGCLVGCVPMRAVPRLMLNVVAAMISCHALAFCGLSKTSTTGYNTSLLRTGMMRSWLRRLTNAQLQLPDQARDLPIIR